LLRTAAFRRWNKIISPLYPRLAWARFLDIDKAQNIQIISSHFLAVHSTGVHFKRNLTNTQAENDAGRIAASVTGG
jgi:hypothetical protein